MATIIFVIACFIVSYVWFGYYILLEILVRIFPDRRIKSFSEDFKPLVSIIVSLYNEEAVVEKKILDLAALDYPQEALEILIASDGSTDKTLEIAQKYIGQGLVVIGFTKNRGTAEVYNDLIKQAKGEILVFTDADTTFGPSFLKNIVRPFSNPKVGAVVGKLVYRVAGGDIAENEGFYWSYELKLRELEDRLGLLHNGTGACMAIRRKLYQRLSPVDHVDTATVIDIILQGFKIVYEASAIAYDIPSYKAKTAYRVRARGTSKTLSSLFQKARFKGWCKKPVLVWCLFSHRLGRYFTPYLMIIVLISNALILKRGVGYQILFAVQLSFYLLVLVGWLGHRMKKKIHLASSCFSFFVAMLGMMVGVARALRGKVTVTFKTDDNL